MDIGPMESRIGSSCARGVRTARIAATVAIALAVLGLAAFSGKCAYAQTVDVIQDASMHATADTSKHAVGWSVRSSNVYCKVDGKAQKGGIKDIGKRSYLFDKKGRQLTGWRKVGKSYYFFKPGAKTKGYMVKGKVVNGVRLGKSGKAVLSSESRKQLNVLVKAQKFVDKYTRLNWPEKKKLRKCFNVLRDDYPERALRGFTHRNGWTRLFALDIFDKKTGSCHSYACAFAYIANAIGSKRCKAVSSGGHSWAEVNGSVYDPEWAKHCKVDLFDFPYSRSGYGGAPRYKNARAYVVTISPNSNAMKGAGALTVSSVKNGLVSKSGKLYFFKNGKKVKSKWVTTMAAKYYMKSNGAAVTGPTKIKGSYYVFSQKGRLFTGKKTRVVTYKGLKYRVTKSGRAKSGWDSSKKHRYDKKGKLYAGVCVIGDKLYAFSASGVYNGAKTSLLQAAARYEKDFNPLRAHLGKPKKSTYVDSCYRLVDSKGDFIYGDDGILDYGNFRVYTFKGDDGIEYYRGAEAK